MPETAGSSWVGTQVKIFPFFQSLHNKNHIKWSQSEMIGV
ncbi:hypothetical protein AD00_4516 [Escherichia coli 2-316-03_S4_C2]|nr:hypothetical protein AD00_4516 [Escherichia coli 2-316-03_S4_C2]